MLKRTSRASFAGGMFVFPGGRVDGDDHLHKYDLVRTGPGKRQAAQAEALGAEWRGYWIAGIRECFEEAGLLLAYRGGALLSYANAEERQRFASYRQPLHGRALRLFDICQREGLKLAVDRIHFHSRFITPLGRPRRFDTRFFIAAAPEGQRGRHDEHETVDSVWVAPDEALRRHRDGAFGLMNVTRVQLERLACHRSAEAAIAAAADNRHFPVHRPVLPPSQVQV